MPDEADDNAPTRMEETRPFGSTGVEVPVIGQGTWKVRDRGAARNALRRGLDLGLTHIDTAELYTGSEETIRPVLEGRRDEVFLVSKVKPPNTSFNGTFEACEGSLERLGVDRLDCYLVHWYDERNPVSQTMAAMGDLLDQGKINAVGVSNFSIELLEAAEDALGKGKIACNQVLYHLEERSIEAEILPYCRRKGIAVVGYSPFGSGDFVDPKSAGGKVLQEVAEAHGKTPRQVALRFLTRDTPLFTIPKAEKVEHVEDNAGGAGWRLSKEDTTRLDEAFPVPERVVGVPTL